MKFDNAFLGSFDPFHAGHLWTWLRAETALWPTHIVVCKNSIKDDGWLTTEQRRLDIIYTLLMSENFDASTRDPEEIVITAKTWEEIAQIFSTAQTLVRWIRGPEDITYNELLMQKLWLESLAKEKAHYIQVPESHRDISSTTNKIVLQQYLQKFRYVPKIYRKTLGYGVYHTLKNMDFPHQSRNITPETREKVQNNIEAYFTKLEKL
jgi:cytidyltransferase-like protein